MVELLSNNDKEDDNNQKQNHLAEFGCMKERILAQRLNSTMTKMFFLVFRLTVFTFRVV